MANTHEGALVGSGAEHEAFEAEHQLQLEALRKDMEQFGGEDVVLDKLGLAPEELVKDFSAPGYEGNLWGAVRGALIPPEDRPPGGICPVGETIRLAKEKDGMAGVHEKVAVWNSMTTSKPIVVSVATEKRVAQIEDLKKKKLNAAKQSGHLSLQQKPQS